MVTTDSANRTGMQANGPTRPLYYCGGDRSPGTAYTTSRVTK